MKHKKLNMAQYGMLAPNVQRGGQAIPMGNNLYLMKGRQHSAGGIDIGKDLEVENNEVMQMLPNETRVFSSMPMLGGYSPAQLVANGNNPDLVFNAQERWKQENRVRDDGSTYKGGGIYINPANKGKFTAQAKQHGMGVQPFANKVLAHKENYSPTTVKRATFAKYIGGRKPFGGSAIGTPLSSLPLLMIKYGYKNNKNDNLNMNNEAKVMKMLKNVTPKNNYEEAVDGYPSLGFTIKNILNHNNAPKSGLSNCTLTVSQLYNPKRPINHARTITKNPRGNGFYEVGPEHVIPGSMVIASNSLNDDDENNKYHTMVVNGFADKDYVYDFDGKSYDVKAGTPLVSYSRGGNNSSDWRTNIPIDVYLANGEGKNVVRYYRPLDKNGNPNVLLDELVVSPNKKYGGSIHNDGGNYKRRKAKAGELNVDLPGITVYQALQETPPNFIDKAIYNLGAKMIDYNDSELYDFLNLYRNTFDKNGKLTKEGRENIERDLKWYKSKNDNERDFLLESAYEKILNGENSFAVNAFGELVAKEKIMNEASKLEHEWRMENDRAYRDKMNNAGETFDNRYDRISNLPIAEGNNLYNALSWQYDQNNLENQELEKNKADRFAYNQHKGLTESFALPFYIAGALPGLTALPGVLGPLLAAHDTEAAIAGMLSFLPGLFGLDWIAAKHDRKVAYDKKMGEIKDYINTPWVSNAIKEARTDIDKSADIMSQIRYDWLVGNEEKYENGELPFIEGYSVGGDGSPQNSFLLNRDAQREYLLNAGYIEKPGDYGLVQQAVKDTGRDIPVYQQIPDYVDRKDLTPIGNLWNHAPGDEGWIAYSEPLEHAGNYKTALYIDNNTGNFYQKAWDLNDYSGGRQGLEGNGLDAIGNPIVVTTGFQRVDPKRILELENNGEFEPTDNWKEVLNKLKQRKQYGGKTRNMNLQNIYNDSLARFGKRINGSIVRMDGNGIDKLAYIPFTGNRPKTLKVGGRTKAYLGTFAHDNLFNIEYLTNPHTAYSANTTKDNNSTNNDIFKERMKYIEPYFEGQSDIPGYINAGVNALGSVVTSLIANNAINKQRPPVEPMPLIAPKLKTNFNINADLDANREETRQAINEVKRNTASSHVGRNLINQQLFTKALADSKLYTDKENKETTLINDDITQRAEIINKNIEKGNAYRQSLADFYSNKALAKGQNWGQMVNGLGQAIGMGLNNIGATNTKKLNALIAMLPAIETFMKNKKV